MEKHAESIEADLHREYRLDLLDWFRGVHPWPKLYRLLLKLPTESDYKSDLLMDEDIAHRILEEEKKNPVKDDVPVPSMTPHGFTRELATMMQLLDAVRQLNSTLIAVNLPKGKSAPRVPRSPRPVTALDRLRKESEESRMTELLQQAGVM